MEHFNTLYDYYVGEGNTNHVANHLALASIQTKDAIYEAVKAGELK